MERDILIRNVAESDAEAIAAIYGHHVIHGTATYDTEPPSVADTLAKIRRITAAEWPFLVAQVDGAVAGYAYVTQIRDRPGYRFTAEDSIYVDAAKARRGIGRALLAALTEQAAAFGFRMMIAVVGGADPGSIAVHASAGFAEVGRLRSVGYKHDRWLDNVYMQRELLAGTWR